MTALASVREDPVEVARAGRLLEPCEQKRVLDPKALEEAAARFQRLVEQRAAVEVKEVEDHEHDRHLLPQLACDLLATQPALELEEPQHAAVPVREHLAVKQDGVSETQSALRQLRECASGLFQVAREELDPTTGVVELAAHAVVLLLGPDLVRAHPLEGLACGLHRACEHEANRLKESDCRRVELSALAANRRLSDVTRDEVNALDLGHRQSEGFCDRGFDEALAESNAHLAGDDLDHEAGALRVQPPQELLEGRRLGFAARGPYRLQRLFELHEGHLVARGAALERLARPVADVGMLSENGLELIGISS